MASLAKFAFGKIAYALSDYMVNPVPLAAKDQNGVTQNIAICFAKPTKINRDTQIGLVVVGNLDEQSVKLLEKELIAAIALGHHRNLLEHQKGKLKPANFKILSNSFAEHQFSNKGIMEFGALFARMILNYPVIRKEILKTSGAKGIKWNVDFDKHQVKAKEDKYKGRGGVITYWEKGLMGQANWIVPLEAVHLWQHVRIYPGSDADHHAKELFGALLAGDGNRYKIVCNDIESMIRKEDKARRKRK